MMMLLFLPMLAREVLCRARFLIGCRIGYVRCLLKGRGPIGPAWRGLGAVQQASALAMLSPIRGAFGLVP